MKRHHPPAPRPTAPSIEYAVVHRLVSVLCGKPINRFAGCSFPTCPCEHQCVIYDAGVELVATDQHGRPHLVLELGADTQPAADAFAAAAEAAHHLIPDDAEGDPE